MIIPLKISATFEIMGYDKLRIFFTSPNFNVFLKTVLVISRSFVNQDIQMYTICKSSCFFTSFHKLKNGHIFTIFIVQRAVKPE